MTQPYQLMDPVPGAEPGPGADRDGPHRSGLWATLAGTVALLAVVGVFWPTALKGILLLFLVIIVPMVLFHEWGHYVTARRFGMSVREFFLGFGPRLWSFRRGETEYGIKALFPLGGYVKIVGFGVDEDVRPEEVGRTFRDKPAWQRAIVLVAGSTTHFVTALVLMFVVLVAVGVPAPATTLGAVEKGSAAEDVGLRAGDRLVSVAGVSVRTWDDAQDALRARPGQDVVVRFERGGRVREVTAHLGSVESEGRRIGRLGVVPGERYERVSPLRAVPETFARFGDAVTFFVGALAKTFSPSNLRCLAEQVTGGRCRTDYRFSSPVGIASAAEQSASRGIFTFLWLVISINVFVGFFNLLPLLPLDGGHLFVLALETVATKIRRRPVRIDERVLLPFAIGFLGLMLMLFFSAVYLDITSPVKLR